MKNEKCEYASNQFFRESPQRFSIIYNNKENSQSKLNQTSFLKLQLRIAEDKL